MNEIKEKYQIIDKIQQIQEEVLKLLNLYG